MEIVEARKALWPEYRSLRSRYENDKVYIAYPAKLVHNDRIVRDEFPNWDSFIRRSRAKPQSRIDRHETSSRDQIQPRAQQVSLYDCSTESSPAASASNSDADIPMLVTTSDQSTHDIEVQSPATQSNPQSVPDGSLDPDPATPSPPVVLQDAVTPRMSLPSWRTGYLSHRPTVAACALIQIRPCIHPPSLILLALTFRTFRGKMLKLKG